MIDFLIAIFEVLGFYTSSDGLGEHLRGFDLDCLNYSRNSLYNLIFLYLFIINSLIMINYYYGIFNRHPFGRLGWWLINSLIGPVILFFTALMYTYNDFSTSNYCNQLQISSMDCYGFALTTAIYSFIWCILFSLLIKWKSSNNRKIPF